MESEQQFLDKMLFLSKTEADQLAPFIGLRKHNVSANFVDWIFWVIGHHNFRKKKSF
jgi:hypothetical protein